MNSSFGYLVTSSWSRIRRRLFSPQSADFDFFAHRRSESSYRRVMHLDNIVHNRHSEKVLVIKPALFNEKNNVWTYSPSNTNSFIAPLKGIVEATYWFVISESFSDAGIPPKKRPPVIFRSNNEDTELIFCKDPCGRLFPTLKLSSMCNSIFLLFLITFTEWKCPSFNSLVLETSFKLSLPAFISK